MGGSKAVSYPTQEQQREAALSKSTATQKLGSMPSEISYRTVGGRTQTITPYQDPLARPYTESFQRRFQTQPPQTQQPTEVNQYDGRNRFFSSSRGISSIVAQKQTQIDRNNIFVVRPSSVAASSIFFPKPVVRESSVSTPMGESNGYRNIFSALSGFGARLSQTPQGHAVFETGRELIEIPKNLVKGYFSFEKYMKESGQEYLGLVEKSGASTRKELIALAQSPEGLVLRQKSEQSRMETLSDPNVQGALTTIGGATALLAAPSLIIPATAFGVYATGKSGVEFFKTPTPKRAAETIFSGATTLLGSAAVLKSTGITQSFQTWRLASRLPTEQRATFYDILAVEKGTRGLESPVKKTFQYAELSNVKPVAKEARTVLLTEPDAVAFGSGAGASQTPTTGSAFYGRRLGDMDIFVENPALLQQKLLTAISNKGFKAEGSGIVRSLDNAKKAHAFDIKPFKVRVETVQDVHLNQRPGESPLANVWDNLRTYQIGKDVKIVKMEQLTTAKAASLSGVRQVKSKFELGPPPHRAMKDIGDFFKQADFLLTQSPTIQSPKKIVSVTKAQQALARLKVDPYIQKLLVKGNDVADLSSNIIIGRGEKGIIPVSRTRFTELGGLEIAPKQTPVFTLQRPGLKTLPVTETSLKNLMISEARMTPKGTLETTGVSRMGLRSSNKSRTTFYERPTRISLIERPSQLFSNVGKRVIGSFIIPPVKWSSKLPSPVPSSPSQPSVTRPYEPPSKPSRPSEPSPSGSNVPSDGRMSYFSTTESSSNIMPRYDYSYNYNYVPPSVPSSTLKFPKSGGSGQDMFSWERRKRKKDVYAPSIIATGLKLRVKKSSFNQNLITPFGIRPLLE